MEHTLIVAGIGPGDPDYILPKAQKAIEGARYLVGSIISCRRIWR